MKKVSFVLFFTAVSYLLIETQSADFPPLIFSMIVPPVLGLASTLYAIAMKSKKVQRSFSGDWLVFVLLVSGTGAVCWYQLHKFRSVIIHLGILDAIDIGFSLGAGLIIALRFSETDKDSRSAWRSITFFGISVVLQCIRLNQLHFSNSNQAIMASIPIVALVLLSPKALLQHPLLLTFSVWLELRAIWIDICLIFLFRK